MLIAGSTRKLIFVSPCRAGTLCEAVLLSGDKSTQKRLVHRLAESYKYALVGDAHRASRQSSARFAKPYIPSAPQRRKNTPQDAQRPQSSGQADNRGLSLYESHNVRGH